MPNAFEQTPAGEPQVMRRSAAGDLFSRFAVQVLRLAGELGTAGDALCRPVGQSSARWRVLAMVEEEPATVAEVARHLGLARQSVQRVADALVGDGLATYAGNPRHRRAKLLELTCEGRGTLRAIQTAQCGWADTLGARIGEEELSRACDVLQWALAALTEEEQADA
jgi:DNA-binding MarR family transcriptional regulator